MASDNKMERVQLMSDEVVESTQLVPHEQDSQLEFTVEQAIESFGFGPFQWKMFVLAGMSWVITHNTT